MPATEAATRDIRIASTSMFHAPGILRWLQNVYRDDPRVGVDLMAGALPELPLGVGVQFLRGDIDFTLDGDTAVFTVRKAPDPGADRSIFEEG